MIFDNSIIAHLINDPEYAKQTGFTQSTSRGVSVVHVPTGWDVLHGYNPREWHADAAKAFMDEFNARHVPLDCDCRAHWRAHTADCPPVFTTNEEFARWGFDSHNAVNTRLERDPFSWRSFLSRYRPDLIPPQQSTTELLAVTSLAPHRIERQSQCLDSWRKLGLQIVSVNSPAEVDAIATDYPQVGTWIAVESETNSCPMINSLLDVSMSAESPILLINADIEMYGDQSRLLDLVATRKNAIGIRHNYQRYRTDAKQEGWGLDAFLVYPEQVARLSRVKLPIGKPLWDYWLGKEITDTSFCEWIAEPYFYHQSHPVNWTGEDLAEALRICATHFGPIDWEEWRYSVQRFRTLATGN